MPYDEIRYEVAERVATITLARPQRRNAWTRCMGQEFRDALAAAGAADEVRAIVVTGAGPDFCVGADLESDGGVFAAQAAAEAAGEARRPLRAWSLAILGALEPVPGPERLSEGNRAVEDFKAYLRRLIADRRRRPGQDPGEILTALLANIVADLGLPERAGRARS